MVDLVSLVVFEFICIVEEVLDLKCFEELFWGFVLEVLWFLDNVVNGDILDLFRRVDVLFMLVMVDWVSFFGVDCVFVDSILDV